MDRTACTQTLARGDRTPGVEVGFQSRRTVWLALLAAASLAGALPTPAADAAPIAAPAGGTIYNIEIIVFRAAGAMGGAENWSAEADTRSIAGDEGAGGFSQVGHFVASLPTSVWQLTELENRLRATRRNARLLRDRIHR